MTGCRSGEDPLRDAAGGVGQAEVAAGVAERQPRVVQPEQVQDGGVQVVGVHRPLDGPDELALRPSHLQMQTADGLPGRARVIVLNEGSGDAVGAIALEMIRLEEETTSIAVHIGLDDQDF